MIGTGFRVVVVMIRTAADVGRGNSNGMAGLGYE